MKQISEWRGFHPVAAAFVKMPRKILCNLFSNQNTKGELLLTESDRLPRMLVDSKTENEGPGAVK